MDAYVDYDFYTNTYHGKAIPKPDFDQLALRASYWLSGRITDPNPEGDLLHDVKMATCAIAETVHKHAGHEGLAAETVGKHSVTYGSSAQDKKGFSVEDYMLDAGKTYLLHTGLLYRGVYL